MTVDVWVNVSTTKLIMISNVTSFKSLGRSTALVNEATTASKTHLPTHNLVIGKMPPRMSTKITSSIKGRLVPHTISIIGSTKRSEAKRTRQVGAVILPCF